MSGEYDCCGECRWHRKDDGEWECTNPDSEYYGMITGYEDWCEEREERRR